MVPREAPLPTPANFPFQSWRRGIHNSKSISDPAFSVTLPITRQNGLSTLILTCEPRCIGMLNGGCTNSADLIDQRVLPPPVRVVQAVPSGSAGSLFVCAETVLPRSKIRLRVREYLFTVGSSCRLRAPLHLQSALHYTACKRPGGDNALQRIRIYAVWVYFDSRNVNDLRCGYPALTCGRVIVRFSRDSVANIIVFFRFGIRHYGQSSSSYHETTCRHPYTPLDLASK
jgi:hypothetical protein